MTAPAIAPYQPLEGFNWNPAPVDHHGGAFVYPGRLALAGDWPHTPATCSDNFATAWDVTDRVLICTGCGLDVS